MTPTSPQFPPTVAFICELEMARTQSLVGKLFAHARQLHAPEYQLITPGGKTFDRESYLAEIEAGNLEYARWDMAEMRVRASPDMAIVRYQARLQFPSDKVVHCWHTDSYELRDQRWQAVWSQATAILPGA